MTGKSASVSDPNSWCSYSDAIHGLETGKGDYLGFVFTDNLGLVAIDIDKGYDGLFPSDLAMDIIETCKSYTELSKSGRGFHIILKGELSFKGRNNNEGLEIYKSGRYFIMTGNNLCYNAIESNQNAINYILDKYFIEYRKSLETAKNSVIFNYSYNTPTSKMIDITPNYPKITVGGRNNSMTSLAGQLKVSGYRKEDTLKQLIIANLQSCEPPLKDRELESIVNSVYRYKK